MKILVTGGCGFIGSNFIRRLLRNDLYYFEQKEIFKMSLKETMEWYKNNESWWRPLKPKVL